MTTDPERMVTMADVAQLAGCSVKTVRRAISDGELPAFYIGTAIRVCNGDARAWRDERTAEAKRRAAEKAAQVAEREARKATLAARRGMIKAKPIPEAFKPTKPRPTVYLYAIQVGTDGPVKIGLTKKPWIRLRDLQIANPNPLRGLAAWETTDPHGDEAAFHERFADQRIRGEWFQPTPFLLWDVKRRGGDYETWDMQ